MFPLFWVTELTPYLSYQLTTELHFSDKLPGWRPSHTNLLVFSPQTNNRALPSLLESVPVITSRHEPRRKHHSSVAVPLLRSCLLGFPRDRYSASPLARRWLSSNGCLFRGRCLETNVVSEPFAGNGCSCGTTVLALSKYATMCNIYI
jgi:hypothetical protein